MPLASSNTALAADCSAIFRANSSIVVIPFFLSSSCTCFSVKDIADPSCPSKARLAEPKVGMRSGLPGCRSCESPVPPTLEPHRTLDALLRSPSVNVKGFPRKFSGTSRFIPEVPQLCPGNAQGDVWACEPSEESTARKRCEIGLASIHRVIAGGCFRAGPPECDLGQGAPACSSCRLPVLRPVRVFRAERSGAGGLGGRAGAVTGSGRVRPPVRAGRRLLRRGSSIRSHGATLRAGGW